MVADVAAASDKGWLFVTIRATLPDNSALPLSLSLSVEKERTPGHAQSSASARAARKRHYA